MEFDGGRSLGGINQKFQLLGWLGRSQGHREFLPQVSLLQKENGKCSSLGVGGEGGSTSGRGKACHCPEISSASCFIFIMRAKFSFCSIVYPCLFQHAKMCWILIRREYASYPSDPMALRPLPATAPGPSGLWRCEASILRWPACLPKGRPTRSCKREQGGLGVSRITPGWDIVAPYKPHLVPSAFVCKGFTSNHQPHLCFGFYTHPMALLVRPYGYPHSTGGKTKAGRRQTTCPSSYSTSGTNSRLEPRVPVPSSELSFSKDQKKGWDSLSPGLCLFASKWLRSPLWSQGWNSPTGHVDTGNLPLPRRAGVSLMSLRPHKKDTHRFLASRKGWAPQSQP